ncbi:MAG TPA: amidase family protein, partial [Aggregatilineales bacterium]|nr:amidase family protein [Aggregatilineales bacterium]
MTDLTHLTITEALAQLDAGTITSVQLTQAYLNKINQLDPQIKAYLTISADIALDQAQNADDLRAQGVKKPLLGIPMGIKDVLSTKGIQTTAGSK